MVSKKVLLIDHDELLHRQVHPNWINDGRISSQAFVPFPKDECLLSVDRGRLVGAKKAYQRHVEGKGFQSAGVWSVTVGECNEHELSVVEDPIEDDDCPNPAHCLIDFTRMNASKMKRVGKKLRDLAQSRGATHRPESA